MGASLTIFLDTLLYAGCTVLFAMETLLVAHYPQMPRQQKTETILVAHNPQMPPSENTGTSLLAHYPQMPLLVKNGDNPGSTLSANATVS